MASSPATSPDGGSAPETCCRAREPTGRAPARGPCSPASSGPMGGHWRAPVHGFFGGGGGRSSGLGNPTSKAREEQWGGGKRPHSHPKHEHVDVEVGEGLAAE